jgi:hypothetical protein
MHLSERALSYPDGVYRRGPGGSPGGSLPVAKTGVIRKASPCHVAANGTPNRATASRSALDRSSMHQAAPQARLTELMSRSSPLYTQPIDKPS